MASTSMIVRVFLLLIDLIDRPLFKIYRPSKRFSGGEAQGAADLQGPPQGTPGGCTFWATKLRQRLKVSFTASLAQGQWPV